ncbi:Structural maintenance of chromosomes protein 4 [Nymphaea thermarum]|nr:Structural maintenance of chromosomes protein 4 [Nymphaea thermarum]
MVLRSHPSMGCLKQWVSVLGGGQLGRMLCQAASCLGIKILIMDPSEDCSASSMCHRHVLGSFDDGASVQKFAKELVSWLPSSFHTLSSLALVFALHHYKPTTPLYVMDEIDAAVGRCATADWLTVASDYCIDIFSSPFDLFSSAV